MPNKKLVLKKPQAVAPKAHGKNVFEGTIGASRYLFDAGNGDKVKTLASNTAVADQAEKLGRVLIPRDKAAHFAVRRLFRDWAIARKALKQRGKKTTAAKSPSNGNGHTAA